MLTCDQTVEPLLTAMGMLGNRLNKAIVTSLQFSERLWGRELGVSQVQNLKELEYSCMGAGAWVATDVNISACQANF